MRECEVLDVPRYDTAFLAYGAAVVIAVVGAFYLSWPAELAVVLLALLAATLGTIWLGATVKHWLDGEWLVEARGHRVTHRVNLHELTEVDYIAVVHGPPNLLFRDGNDTTIVFLVGETRPLVRRICSMLVDSGSRPMIESRARGVLNPEVG